MRSLLDFLDQASPLDLCAPEQMPDTEQSPSCQMQGAEDLHGEGEDAIVWAKNICPQCAHNASCLLGVQFLAMVHAAHQRGLTYTCEACAHTYSSSAIAFVTL